MLLAALSALFPVSLHALSPAGGTALGAGLQAGAAVVRSPLWPVNSQSWISMRLLLETPLADPLGLGFSLSYHFVDESDPVAGVLYRGHNGLEVGACLLFRSVLTSDRARGGLGVGGSANFDVYNMTELLFFYPSLIAEPYLELPIEGPPRHTFSFGLPCRLDYRMDLDLSASIGLEVSWRWYPAWKEGT
jgi:hypothetical protein